MTRATPPRGVVVTVVVACVLAVGAQIAAALWGSAAPDPVQPEPPRAAHDVGCGSGPCRVLASTVVNGMPVELLADRDGGHGRLRAGAPSGGAVTEVTLTEQGIRLHHDSLRCARSATPVCLVRGSHNGEVAGEVHTWRGDAWQAVGGIRFADGGAVVLDDVVDSGLPEVVLVRRACAGETGPGHSPRDGVCSDPGVLAQVVTLDGGSVGCTRPVGSPGDLRGWPEVDVTEGDLTACPADLDAS
ncbi:hypothetical protein ACWGRK_20770 [Saccharomonospora azurea]|uniref:hypothetical protein n=1 Tax=Saccharomonospora azurea TaxID=40988 RepID=UPI0006824682|nr:hypothetical protein [Saccharomonospora azurea]